MRRNVLDSLSLPMPRGWQHRTLPKDEEPGCSFQLLQSCASQSFPLQEVLQLPPRVSVLRSSHRSHQPNPHYYNAALWCKFPVHNRVPSKHSYNVLPKPCQPRTRHWWLHFVIPRYAPHQSCGCRRGIAHIPYSLQGK